MSLFAHGTTAELSCHVPKWLYYMTGVSIVPVKAMCAFIRFVLSTYELFVK